MRWHLRQFWPLAKGILAVAIVGGVGWQFARLLHSPELWQRPLEPRPPWLAACALAYLLALAFPLTFWFCLLRAMGERPTVAASVRAYYIGHLGKYVPGKAWALVLRSSLMRACGVRAGVAALTATYETLTTMATGALVAGILLTLHALDEADRWKAWGLLALAGIPILPGVFNRLVDRFTALARKGAGKPPDAEASVLPPLRHGTLALGVALTACGWALMGLSLWALVQAVVPEPPAWSWDRWGRYTAFVALAYVAGFLALPAPGGLGVRELILQRFLTPELAQSLPLDQAGPLAVVIVLLLRLLWTGSEVIMAGAVYFLPSSVVELPTDAAKDQLPMPLANEPSTTDHGPRT